MKPCCLGLWLLGTNHRGMSDGQSLQLSTGVHSPYGGRKERFSRLYTPVSGNILFDWVCTSIALPTSADSYRSHPTRGTLSIIP